jgi:hypothetical protein
VAGIHRSGYSVNRPVLAAGAPLTLAPGATVSVFDTGTATLSSLFTDQALTNPLANPFVTDANAYYDYWANPSTGDVDEQFSGTGIDSPYAVTHVLGLDPRFAGVDTDVADLVVALAQEVNDRAAGDSALQAIGVRYPLGGSIQSGVQSAARIDVIDAVLITIDGDKFEGYTLKVFVTVKTDDAATSVTPVLRNVTTAADAGTGTASVSTSAEDQEFDATIAAGINQYKLQIEPENDDFFLYALGYCELSAP